MKIEFRDLTEDEIEIRVGQAIKSEKFEGCTLLLYKNARVDMDLLDEVVGAENWQRSHSRENANCTVSIWDKDKSQWVSKEDTGTDSNTEAEKGRCSDSFKRCCVNWGIGRSLYSSPRILVSCKLDNSGKRPASGIGWYVKEIGYTDNHKINKLVIMETKHDKDTQVVFDWTLENGQAYIKPTNTATSPESDKSKNEPPKEEKPVTRQTTQASGMTMEQALAYTVTWGVHKGKAFKDMPENYLRWIVEKNENAKTREAATLVLQSIEQAKKEID